MGAPRAYPYALGAPITYSAHAPVAAPVTYSVPAPVVAPVTYTAQAPVAPVHEYTLPVTAVHECTLPVAPVFDGKAPEPVQDNPEVAAAKAVHIALVESNTLPETPMVYE